MSLIGREKMEKKYGLSQTEYELMEFFWSTEDKLSFKQILEYLLRLMQQIVEGIT